MTVLFSLLSVLRALTLASSPASPPPTSSIVVGDTRVTALSPTLVRIEPKGLKGFEDRSTFNVVGRDAFEATALPIKVLNSSKSGGTWLATSAYHIHLPAKTPGNQCVPQTGVDANRGVRSGKYPNGTHAKNVAACCELCLGDADCVAWTSAPEIRSGVNCWPFSHVQGTKAATHPRTFGFAAPDFVNATIATPAGRVLWQGANTGNSAKVAANELHWPSPLDGPAYAFEDRPRFFVPEWGPTPIPAGANVPAELMATNGYDFTNDAQGDIYVFLLGDTLQTWYDSRGEFLTLTGPTPLLPDFAFGVWYTWYIKYTEQRAKDEIGNWTAAKLPLDVWALDMNWRHIGVNDTRASVNYCKSQLHADPGCRDHFYSYPNLDLMPGLASPGNEWFEFIKAQKLRTYFNDHPFPLDNQTTPKEVGFRFNGISEWIGRGLSFWWFDHNWGFTVPGPRMPPDTKASYEGLSGQVWGSHIYYESTAAAYTKHRISDRPIALSRDNGPGGWRTDNPEAQLLSGAGAPAHHRYPVWWTGDGVSLMASVESMVDEAVHDFRAFVHSDCGGHGDRSSCPATVTGAPPEDKACSTPNNQALLRWTAHCVLGTVVRYHQGDHRFWLRSNDTLNTARNYLNMRYALAPSLISAGRLLQRQGFPLTARCDLLWPEHEEANDPTQYIHLNATLVAPLDVEPVDKVTNTRSVWIPPGDWVDGWSGKQVTGPQTINVTQPADKIPMWHKRGSVLITDHTPNNLRIEGQDWSELTIEAFPSSSVSHETRTLYAQEKADTHAAPTTVGLSTLRNGTVIVEASPSPMHAWVVRVHLRPGQQVLATTPNPVRHILSDCTKHHTYFPFAGPGSSPPCHAGPIAEFRVPASVLEWRVVVTVVAA